MKVVYVTNTGSTERYAKMLAEKLECECVELSQAQKDDNEVIFMGWVMAGIIQGISQARTMFGDLKAVCAVGMMVGEKQKIDLIEKNSVLEDFFFLPGSFYLNRLKGMQKMLMSITMKTLKSKLKGNDDPAAQKALQVFDEGFDNVKEENLAELYEFLGVE